MGKISLNIFALFLYLFFMYVVGSLIFTKGFLLKRDVINRNSSCRVDFARYWDGDSHGAEGCWLHRRFDKAIFIVIDALRFDFIVETNDNNLKNLPYSNKLQSVYNLIKKKPKNSRVYKFIADPPTTTSQRLKGLTTGSLPTFVDVGSNFASTRITEDNFIDQLVKKGKKITFMGDDTWMGLFPNQFNRAFPFPSFNVKDLHTVDNGVLQHLYTEMEKPDWDVVIAHFLGVDHCGHRYGPNHPAMADKLSQMDQVIRNVTSQMDSNTILFVLGDHGMTSTGDHGGDSADELNAGLFVYSPSQITSSKYVENEYKTISQIDIVPTVSLLLGLPIPFSNLGSIITDILNYCSWSKHSHIKEVYHTVEALRLNARQISEYVDQYGQVSTDLPHYKFTLLQQKLQHTEDKLQRLATAMFVNNHADNVHKALHDIEKEYKLYIGQIQNMCKDVWAKFDMTSMFLGILVFAVALLVNIYVLTVDNVVSEDKGMGTVIIVVVASGVFVVYSIVQTLFLQGGSVSLMAFILGTFDFVAIAIIIYVVKQSKEKPKQLKEEKMDNKNIKNLISNMSVENVFSYLAIAAFSIGYFTNSFIIHEDSISLFATQSIMWVFCSKIVQGLLKDSKLTSVKEHYKSKSKTHKNYDVMKFITHPIVIVIILTISCNFFISLSSNFYACREEQVNCTRSSFLTPLSSVGQTLEGSKNIRYFFCAGCMLFMLYLPRKWLMRYGNLNGSSLVVICGRYLIPTAGVCTVFHWAVQGLPAGVLDSLPIWQQVLFPQIVYVITCLSLLAVAVSPLCVYMIPKHDKHVSIPDVGNGEELIKKVYNHLKVSWDDTAGGEMQNPDTEAPVVYGLATVYSATVIYTGCAVLVLLSLLLGDGLAPSLMSAVAALVLFLELFTVAVRICRDTDLLVPGIVALSLMMTNYFYATGHQATIPSIRFEAAFIGFHGDWDNHIIPAALIYLNTFAAEVFFTVVSPLLILWPCTKGILAGLVLNKKGEHDVRWRGDYVMFENHSIFTGLLVKLFASMFLIYGLKIFASMLAVTLLRRHLMVWKIFAPRFVYQAVSSFTVFAVCLMMILIVRRVHNALTNWIEKLNTKRS